MAEQDDAIMKDIIDAKNSLAIIHKGIVESTKILLKHGEDNQKRMSSIMDGLADKAKRIRRSEGPSVDHSESFDAASKYLNYYGEFFMWLRSNISITLVKNVFPEKALMVGSYCGFPGAEGLELQFHHIYQKYLKAGKDPMLFWASLDSQTKMRMFKYYYDRVNLRVPNA